MRRHLLTVFVLSTASFAVTATQTDWSGGSGVPGPVTDWSNTYYTGNQISHTGNSLLLMSGILGTPVEHTVDSTFNGAWSVYATDIDSDGDVDVLGSAQLGSEIAWWENCDTAPGLIWTKHIVDDDFEESLGIFAIDINEDGRVDVIGASPEDDEIAWWENKDTTWTKHTVDNDFLFAYSVYATDVNGDGHVDVLGAAQTSNEITWWENTNGTGTVWTEHTVDGEFYSAASVYATDVNGDGYVDVLGASFALNSITWWENTDGTGTVWTEHTVDQYFWDAHSVYAADVNGDGDMDVLGASAGDAGHDITWWENTDGTGTSWIMHIVSDDFSVAASVYATDVDGDGDVDVLGAAKQADDITWWENADGTGTVWTEHLVDGDFNGAVSVYATDVDGDGYVDVLGSAYYADEITWWHVMGFSPAGDIESSILDAGTVEFWDNFASSGDEPAGTSVGFQFRSSDDSANMGAWSDTVFTSGTSLSGILADSTDYFQYKVILRTTNPVNTPELQDVTVSYSTYVSVDDNNGSEVTFWNLAPAANPSFGNCAVLVSVPQSGAVDLVLHDITGRIVSQHSQELPSGTHSVYFNNLAEGVYFCTMRGGDFTATERIVVLK